MTVWFIYKTIGGLTPFLYAFTNKEYLIKSFKEERKSSLFHIVKREMEKDDEFKEFQQIHHRLELGRRGFYTSSPISLGSKEIVYLTATQEEEDSVSVRSDSIVFELGKNITDFSCSFNKELTMALANLYYYEIKSFCEASEYDLSEGEFTSYIENKITNASFDELEVFISLYGNTLK